MDSSMSSIQHAKGAVHKAEAGEEPDNDGGTKDDRAGLFDKGPAALPHVHPQDTFRRGQVVLRQLHDERGGVAGEQLGLLEDDAGDDDGRDADKVGRGRHPPAAPPNMAPAIRAMIGILAPQGIKVVVMMVIRRSRSCLNGPGGHNAGDAAAGADQHGDKGLAGQAEAAENPVHDERNARHIAAVLQNGQEEEQDKHLRHKAEHSADAADDAVYNQAVQPVGRANSCQPAADGRTESIRRTGCRWYSL